MCRIYCLYLENQPPTRIPNHQRKMIVVSFTLKILSQTLLFMKIPGVLVMVVFLNKTGQYSGCNYVCSSSYISRQNNYLQYLDEHFREGKSVGTYSRPTLPYYYPWLKFFFAAETVLYPHTRWNLCIGSNLKGIFSISDFEDCALLDSCCQLMYCFKGVSSVYFGTWTVRA